ncbi:myosin heavy chain, skeletal muscle isoform X2 [Scophthalmus maximus]|uniref:myosin heavy chain, skeletal muscle isoform X2 n=1 Tax=Scophthalmus maximus TaxID=52904 RepID=UPI0015E0907E|nr:myosin heavy chain, skeletal muscle isoform X2 [Scophthalmus maximus]
MADRNRDRAEGNAEDTDELLYTDLNVNSSVCDLDRQPLRRDHCDLLLDAIDAQLGQLQVQSKNHQGIFRKHDCSDVAPLQWSQSLSKDTGLGSTTPTNDTPMSCLDLIHTPVTEQLLERSTGCSGGPDTQEDTKKWSDRGTRNKEAMESRREEVIWRLERLLGDTCKEDTIAGEAHPPSDSVCTEDFARRFTEEMVEVPLPESKFQQSDREEEAERCKFTHKTSVVTEQENKHHNESCSPKARCLAGVPVRGFDAVSIASDLDSVCSEQVRWHILTRPGWHCLIQSAAGLDDYSITQSDYDTLTQEESEPQSISGKQGLTVYSFIYRVHGENAFIFKSLKVHRSSFGRAQKRSPSVCKAQQKKRESYRLECSSGDDDKDTDEDTNHWSGRCRSENTSVKMQSAKMKERLANLRQKCEKVEETLMLKKTHLKDVEVCLSELQQRRKHALRELERLMAENARIEKERQTMESGLIDSSVERDSLSCQLRKLQRQRESYVHEIRDMEEELAALSQHKKTLKDGSCMERSSVIMSVLEREEIERQLDSAKTELFAEQRRAREKLESMQENLEQTREELQRATEAERSQRNRCAGLEEKQIQKKEQIEALEAQVSELQVEHGECKIRVGTLEKMSAQKELQLLHLQEQHGTLQAERDGLKGELKHLTTQHYKAQKEAQEQAYRMMVNQQTKEEKAGDLKEHTLALTRCIETMQNSIHLKEEEAKKLRMSLEQRREEARNREEQLHIEVSEKVHKAIEEERRKWETEKVEAVQVHCGILAEQNRKSLESARRETQQEKSKAQALQHKVLQLKTRMQQLESESCAQQREQESVLAVICKSLKEEHQVELQGLKKQMAQESQRTVLRLEQAVHLAEKEADGLQVMLKVRESSSNQITAELDQQHRHWARELGAECQHVQLLLEQSGAKPSALQLPASPTVAEALTSLRALREQLERLIKHLHQELDSQKQSSEQLKKDTERELSTQRQKLRMEKDQALNSLKERLIQEHIEELSSLTRAHMSGGGAEGGGVAASLRKQLKAKDLELRQVQRSMAQWKEQTAARLACKFEEELTAELERCKAKLLRGRKTSKTRGEEQKKFERPEGGKTLNVKETQNSACSPSLHVVDSAASQSPSDVASFKLLRYLQSRVKQLRVENQEYTCSPSPPHTVPLDLRGSYLTTMMQGEGSAGIQSQSAIRTVSS